MATQPAGLLSQYVELMNQGFSPEQIQQQMDEQKAMQFAQMRPEEKIGYNLARGAGQLGRGLSSMFGGQVEDPTMRMASQMRQLQSQFDTTTAEGMMQYAQALRQVNPQMAQQAAAMAQKMALDEAKLGSERALTAQRLRERQAAEPLEQLLRTGKYTPASVAAYQSSKDIKDLELVDKDDPTVLSETKDGIFLINKKTGAKISRIGDAPERGTKVNVSNVMPGGPDTRGKAFEKADTDTLTTFRTESRSAAGQLGIITQARQELAGSSVAGTGIPSVVRSLNNVLAPLGINAESVAKTRNLEQALNSIIAQGIKQYGANPSTVDLEFAKRASASITDPKQAIAATLDYLEKRANAIVDKADAAEQWLLKNNNLAGFDKSWRDSLKQTAQPTAAGGTGAPKATKRFNPQTGQIETIR